jgi:AraC family transcriptional regulator of adaptative response/methylated-DNA-[protein]-cysteine methyltransferase
MKKAMFDAAGPERRVSFALRDSSLGLALIGASGQGLCALMLGDSRETLLQAARARFPAAEARAGGEDFESLASLALGLVEQPRRGWALPLDIEGTPFQRRVWQALREIPAGATASYAQIAERIGQPSAARAVAGACAANRIAVAIPCHRVLRGDGDISGYRWGVARKRELLAREAAA